MEIRKCMNCMEDLPKDGECCPFCGMDNREIQQPAYALGCNSILHGRYLIGRVLGQGGFGITYIGMDLTLNIKVAIKEYFPMGIVTRESKESSRILWNTTQAGQSQRQSGYDSFLKEARKMAKIDQIPAIVRVRDMFLDNETAYIVMDFVEGITLKQKILKEGPLGYSECIRLLRPIMESLAKVHNQGIIHRDISPDNIMIQKNGDVWLLDLGAAKDMSAVHGQASQLVAKKGFSPIEQYMDSGKIGSWTDVYALCATIYYCITGKPLPASLERMGQEKIKFGGQMKEKIPGQAEQALREGLALQQEQRIQTMGALMQQLETGALKPTITKNKGRKKGRHKKHLILAGAALLAFFFVVGLINSGKDKETGHQYAESEEENENTSGQEPQEEKVAVERLGNTNANLCNYGAFACVPGEYEYFIGADNALYVCKSEEEVFYVDESQKVSDFGAYISVGENYVYFARTDFKEYTICRMNFDGTGIEEMYNFGETDFMFMQYAKLSDGKEYLYYIKEKEQGSQLGCLYRRDLSDGKEELLAEEDVLWFNLYEGQFYMTALRGNDTVLLRGDLNGENQEVLDDKNRYTSGYVEDGQMFLYSLNQEALVVCDLDGVADTSIRELYECGIGSDDGNIGGYGDGWIYYNNKEDHAIHRIRANGTGDSVMLKDHQELIICYSSGEISFLEQSPVERASYYQRQLYFSSRDGSTMFALFEPENVWEGLSTAMIGDISYQKNEAGDGIVITGYTGPLTKFQIPKEIEGLPVTEIGEKAFAESEIVKVGLPKGVTTIGERAFFDCEKLDFIGLPEGLIEIGEAAFGQTYSLTQVWLPESLQAIRGMAFAESKLASLYIPANVEYIHVGAFALSQGSELEAFEVSPDNESFKEQDGVLYTRTGKTLCSFPQGKKGSYQVPDGVTGIAPMSFTHCVDLEKVEIPASVKKIGENAFFGCKALKSITVAADCEVEELGMELEVKRGE